MRNMVLAGIKVVDTSLVRDAIDLARSSSEPYLFNHVMRSWLFAVLLSEENKSALDPEVLAMSAILHDLGMTDRYTGAERFEVDSANASVVTSKPAIEGHLKTGQRAARPGPELVVPRRWSARQQVFDLESI